MLALYHRAYGAGRTIADIQWMLEHNPAGAGVSVIAMHKDVVVGMRSLIPYRFRRGSERILTYKTEDSLVAKNYRQRGIFREINTMLYAYEPSILKWGLSNQIDVLRKLGLKGEHQLTSAVYLDASLTGWRTADVSLLSMKGLFLAGVMLRGLFRVRMQSDGDSFLVDDTDAVNLEAFFDEWVLHFPDMLIPDMSHAYLQWRLVDNPSVEQSHIFATVAGDRTVGISIVSVTGAVGRWLSSYFLPQVSTSDQQRHIEQGLSYLKELGVHYVESWLFDHNAVVADIGDSLQKAGFAAMRRGLYIHQNEHAIDTKNVYFSAQLGIR